MMVLTSKKNTFCDSEIIFRSGIWNILITTSKKALVYRVNNEVFLTFP